jgi:D-alanyl-D-alanine carboxypeptidase
MWSKKVRNRRVRKILAALLLGAVLILRANGSQVSVCAAEMTPEQAAQAAAEAAAAAKAEADAQAAAQAAAQDAAKQAAAEAAAAAKAEADAQAAAQAAETAAAAEAAAQEQGSTEPEESEEEANETNTVTRRSSGSGTKKQNTILTEQLLQDIEDSLDSDVQDAIINGYLSLLNKNYILRDELDLDLTSIGNGHQLESRAARIAIQMVKDAKNDGINISVTSSYRTYMKQVSLFKNKIRRLEAQGYDHEEAVKEAGTVVAVPGTSEHQLGLSLDFVTNSYRELDEGIKNTKEYQWLEKHAWEYGYVIRYPFGKSDITGIISEPWHLRYVGIPAAKLISEQGLCLEEFLGVAYDDQKNGISYGAGWVNTGR